MVAIETLRPELQDLVSELAEDLLARSTENADIDDGLRKAFQQIEKGGRTAQAFEVWRDDYLDQVAVAWVLACVFVRFMEDNGLIDECWLAGEGERRKLAEGSHELFFTQHAHDTDREYFQHVFHEVGKIPAAADLFAEGKTPLWALAPSGDAAMKLLQFWREIDAEDGHLLRSFVVENLCLLITGTPAFFDGPQGVQRLEPLAQRLHVDFQTDARFDNPRAVQLRLPPFDHARLLEVGTKVRDLFVTDCSSPARVRNRADDAYIEALARSVAGKLGGKVGIAPRLFLKKLVSDVLDRIDQFDDFDPTRHYQLTVTASELTTVEREAQAVSVDDIEVDT